MLLHQLVQGVKCKKVIDASDTYALAARGARSEILGIYNFFTLWRYLCYTIQLPWPHRIFDEGNLFTADQLYEWRRDMRNMVLYYIESELPSCVVVDSVNLYLSKSQLLDCPPCLPSP